MTASVVPGAASLENVTVLLVDDEPSVLSGLRRSLHGRCVVHTSDDPRRALEIAAELPELAVVVSDMRMPQMDGATLLEQMRTVAPDATRVLLTGYTGIEAAVSAINHGAIFRFLWKPCSPEDLQACLVDAVAQHRLVTAERELLEQTLRGSVRALLETLSLADPLAFGRAERIRARVATILEEFDVEGSTWEVEIAAMLSQLGAVTLQPSVVESLHEGAPLGPTAQEQVDRLPGLSADLVANVPRLEGVRRTILLQNQRFDGRGPVGMGVAGEDIPLGARILQVAIDYDAFDARRVPAREAIQELRSRTGRYDPAVLSALERAVTTVDGGALQVDQIGVHQLRAGMILAADLLAEGDVLVWGRGQRLTQRIVDRVLSWAANGRIIEPVSVIHGSEADAEAS